MKMIVAVALALVAVAAAAPVDEPVPIVRSEFEQQPGGGYAFGYESADGSVRQENGELKEALDEDNKPHQVIVVRGAYSYVDPEGKSQSITYVADEEGYRAEGESIPKAPVARR